MSVRLCVHCQVKPNQNQDRVTRSEPPIRHNRNILNLKHNICWPFTTLSSSLLYFCVTKHQSETHEMIFKMLFVCMCTQDSPKGLESFINVVETL